jgi:integrase/recombinase XerD
MKDFEEYLKHKQLRPRTILGLLLYAKRFLQWLNEEGLTLQDCKYNDLLSFIKKYRDEGLNPNNLNKHLRGVKYYLEHKKEKGEITYNPAINLIVKGEYTTLPKGILSKEQIEQVYNEYEANTPVQKRNKVILGLYVHQGVTREEIENLEPADINLNKGTILIRRNVRLRQRMLPLNASQVLQLQEYLTQVRKQLLKLKGKDSDKLFITIGAMPFMKDALKELLNELQRKYPFLISFTQIRTTVIYFWVKEKNIRETQYLAGHASIHSTQRYKQVSLDDLQLQLDLYHPLRSP